MTMAIRTWYYNFLTQSQGRYNADGEWVRGPAVNSAPLKAFPDDFHVFIVTNTQLDPFKLWIEKENLNIHYEDPEPSFNWRYPNDPAKLWLFVLTCKKDDHA